VSSTRKMFISSPLKPVLRGRGARQGKRKILSRGVRRYILFHVTKPQRKGELGWEGKDLVSPYYKENNTATAGKGGMNGCPIAMVRPLHCPAFLRERD